MSAYGEQDVFSVGETAGSRTRAAACPHAAPSSGRDARDLHRAASPTCWQIQCRDLPPTERTAWLDLKGDRFIREVHFIYSNATRSKARLEVYGEMPRAGSGRARDGAFSSANDGWLYLGGQSPLFVSIRGLGYETDAGSWRATAASGCLDVKNRAITLSQLKVIYSDGSSDTFADRQRVDGGTLYGPVELKSRRPVRQIEVSYRSRIFDLGRAAATRSSNSGQELCGAHRCFARQPPKVASRQRSLQQNTN